jgi:NADH:ubiquinone oxidoreductase subunit 4 (subunit M)
LVSPSIVAHLLRVEGATDTDFYISNHSRFQFLPVSLRDTLPEVLKNTLYVFSLQEGNLELLVRWMLWAPLKRIGARINSLNSWFKLIYGLGGFAVVGLAIVTVGISTQYLSIPISVLMVLASLSAFSQKHSPFAVWNAIALSSILAGVAVWFLNSDAWNDVLIFASGIIPAWVLGLIVLGKLLKNENFAATPFVYRAMAETQPTLSLLLFLSFLGLVGFPISPAFLGEDLLLSHASNHAPWFALPITIAFVINGIAAARVFQRLCMGRPTELNNMTTVMPDVDTQA